MIASERRRHQRAGEALHARARRSASPGRARAPPASEASANSSSASDERPALAEVVGGAAAEHQEAGERDRVGVDDPLQVGRGEAEARLDRGQRDVDDAQVEDDHELRHAADGQQPARARAALRSRRGAAASTAAGSAVASTLMRARRTAIGAARRLVGWAPEPSSDDWSPAHEKNATDRHANAPGRPGEHARGGGLRRQIGSSSSTSTTTPTSTTPTSTTTTHKHKSKPAY